jgi:hypothetical protein
MTRIYKQIYIFFLYTYFYGGVLVYLPPLLQRHQVLFISNLFNDAASNSKYTSNDCMIVNAKFWIMWMEAVVA